jgi:hypothetical protein
MLVHKNELGITRVLGSLSIPQDDRDIVPVSSSADFFGSTTSLSARRSAS